MNETSTVYIENALNKIAAELSTQNKILRAIQDALENQKK